MDVRIFRWKDCQKIHIAMVFSLSRSHKKALSPVLVSFMGEKFFSFFGK